MKNGTKENRNSRKLLILFVVIVVAIVSVIVFLNTNKKDDYFKNSDDRYFIGLLDDYEEENYKIESLDAYYLEDTKMYYYEMKYKLYIDVDDIGWSDIDEVSIGKEGIFTDMFCLNWKASDLEDYKEEIKEFERAKKQGVHKTYDVNDVVEKIKKMQK